MTEDGNPGRDRTETNAPSKGVRRIPGRYALGTTVLLYLVVFAIDVHRGFRAISESADILVRIAPILLVVTVLVAISNYLLTPSTVAAYVGPESGPMGYAIAIGAGIASHGPVYVWYTLLSDLRDRGMRDGLIAVFLYNRAIKLPLLPLFVLYFDLDFAAVLVVYMACASIVQGLVIDRVLSGPDSPLPIASPE